MLTRLQIIAIGFVAGAITAGYVIRRTISLLKGNVTLSNATAINDDSGKTIGYAYAGSDGNTYFDNGSNMYVWNGNSWESV